MVQDENDPEGCDPKRSDLERRWSKVEIVRKEVDPKWRCFKKEVFRKLGNSEAKCSGS